MDYKKIIENKEYDFLRNNPILKDNLVFLVVYGSHAFGTNIPTSDLDIRGVVLDRNTDLLGITNFEQYIDNETDTVIYSLSKFLKLVKECNPSILEMLFCKPEHYLYVSPVGKKLLENRHLFLSQKVIYSFGGYANAQLNRLENAIARDRLDDKCKLEHINRSVENAAYSFETKFRLPENAIKTYVGSWHEGDQEEILVDFNITHYPLSRLKSMVEEMSNVVKDYNSTVGQRNKKKDIPHLNKHMMHLIRLYLMCNEMLEYETLHTYRESEHDLLMDVRNGKYINEDGTVKPQFYDLLNEIKNKNEYLKATTKLPKKINEEDYNRLVLSLYGGIKWN